MRQITLVEGSKTRTLSARVEKMFPDSRSVDIFIRDSSGELFPDEITIKLSARKAALWDELLLDYGTDTAETMLRKFNYVVYRDVKTKTFELLEISNRPFLHTRASINTIHKIFGEYAEAHEQPYQIDRRTVVLQNFPITYKHNGNDVVMYADIRGTWSAFSPDIILQGALKNALDRRGIRLIKDGAAMYLPVMNRWDENLTVGASLLADKFTKLIVKAMHHAATEHATLADCDRIMRVCRLLPKMAEKRSLVLSAAVRQHLLAGLGLFEYETFLGDIYNMDKMIPTETTEADIATIKYFAPSHVSRADIVRYIVELSDLDDVGVIGRRFLNELLFSQRHAALINKGGSRSWLVR